MRERKHLIDMALNVLIALVYLLMAETGLIMATVHQNASPVWPASGVALAVVYYFGPRAALGIWLGAFFANFFEPTTIPVSIGIASGNTAEAIVAVYIFKKLISVETEWKFLLRACAYPVAAAVAAVVSAIIGPTSLLLDGSVKPELFLSVAATWWVGDALGILVFAPLLMVSRDRRAAFLFKKSRWLESIAFIVVSGAVGYHLFFYTSSAAELFLIFPIVLWAAIRFGAFEVRGFIVLVAVIGIYATTRGDGPFRHSNMNQNLLSLQFFLAALTVTAISLGELKDLARLRFSTIALLICWSLSAAVLNVFESAVTERDSQRFQRLITEAEYNLKLRMTIYEDSLRAAMSFLSASEEVKHKEWKTYVRTLNLENRYPGVMGMGLIFPVKKENRAKYTAKARSDVGTHFTIKLVDNAPAEAQDVSYVITYIEPEELNDQAIGLDIASEINRRTAANLARDIGEPVATGPINLVQDTDPRPGFLLLAPFYSAPSSNVEERRRTLSGWVYAPFITEHFFSRALGTLSSQIQFDVFDSDPSGKLVPLYLSGAKNKHF
ncbi:MAG: CHASE domain-containing protein, partial [Bdellovibrionota bacterium]